MSGETVAQAQPAARNCIANPDYVVTSHTPASRVKRVTFRNVACTPSPHGLIVARMGKPLRPQQSIYLDEDKATLLDRLSAETRIPKQVLMREAIDDLLVKHKLLKQALRERRPARVRSASSA